MDHNLGTKSGRRDFFDRLLSTSNLQSHSLNIFDEVIVEDCYRLFDCVNGFDLNQRNEINIIDVGSHEGIFSLYAYELLKLLPEIKESSIKLFSIEGDEQNARLTQEKLQNATNHQVLNKLCAAPGEEYRFKFVHKNTTAGFIYVKSLEELERFKPSWKNKGVIEEVEPGSACLDLSSITKGMKDIFFLKMDCEGCEYTTLENMFHNGEISKVDNLGIELHKTEKEREDLFLKLKDEFGHCEVVNEDYRLAVFSRKSVF